LPTLAAKKETAQMPNKGPAFFVTGSLLFILNLFLCPLTARAHPPWDPYDTTRFAPVDRFGPRIGLETVVQRGTLTAPNKGVIAPGLPNHLFIVDQVGKLWIKDLMTGPDEPLAVFLDVSSLLVRLGVFFGPLCPPGNDPDRPSFDERGLLGLAFHPQFQTNGKFYTYTSEPNNGPPTFPTTLPAGVPADHQNVVSEWTAVNPANPLAGVVGAGPGVPGERRVLMRVDWPQFNHDGGDLAFGPDGLLYISMGDGGGADDRDGQLFIVPYTCGQEAPMVGHGEGNAQNLTNPLGKILRINPIPSAGGSAARVAGNGEYSIPADNPFGQTRGAGPAQAGMPEIFAFGFRNPFRMSFDTASGRLFVGDVGQNDIEEVDIVVRGGNYGWNRKEGTLFFCHNFNLEGFATPVIDPNPARGCPTFLPPGLIDPVAQYDTHHEGHSVIAGFVYRGSKIPDLAGRYVFGDFSRLFKFPAGPHDYGRLFHIPGGGGQGLRRIREFHIIPSNAINLALLGFGQDAAGEVYAMGNVSGLPFPSDGEPPMPIPNGVVVRLVPEPVLTPGPGDQNGDAE
jgi:Glucose / Sorbosone dehydrogenase